MAWNLDDLQKSLLIGSTLIEGSTLSENEALLVLSGKTVQGHPLSEARELLNYQAAVSQLIKEFKKSPYLSNDVILSFHSRLFSGFSIESGKWKSSQNFTFLTSGDRYDFESPSKVDGKIQEWIEKFNQKINNVEASSAAAQLYYEFQRTHPFEYGNGRIGRILIAYWLHWKFSLSFRFILADKLEHLKALEAANKNEFNLLIAFFKKRISKE